MSLDGISGISESIASSSYSSASSTKTKSTAKTSYDSDTAAVYEKSDEAKSGKSNKALIAKLKQDEENRRSQLTDLVRDMFDKQGKAFNTADEMWKMLASGDFTVDAKTAEDAKNAISEDGYWGVEQTSQRIFDFASALSGGDSESMDKMMGAFKKGFEQATKAWGKDLPGISQQTYDAVIKKFDDYKESQNTESE